MMARIRKSSEFKWRPCKYLAAILRTGFQENLFQAWTRRFRDEEAADSAGWALKLCTCHMCYVAPAHQIERNV
jgi:hypothetical protein